MGSRQKQASMCVLPLSSAFGTFCIVNLVATVALFIATW